MGREVSGLSPMGRRLATAQDRQLAAVGVGGTCARLLSARASSRPRRGLVYGGLAAALVVVATLLAVRFHPRSLRYDVGPSRAASVDSWIAAPATEAVRLSFSDGTRIDLTPRSRARVVATDAAGAQLLLERGELEATVQPRPGSRWVLDSGPFRVRVTGTRFSMRWDPEGESLALELHEGSVVVTGPLLGDGRRVSAGETLAVSVGGQRVELTSAEALPARVTDATPTPTFSASSAPRPAPPAGSAPGSGAGEPSWQELARAGKYKLALERAERDGFDEICETANAPDLLALGDAARFAGDSAGATRALSAARRRFPGSGQAAAAAFLLGRAAFDQRGSYGEAGTWFSTYLAEQPGGAFAQEAAGRLVEARERAGDAAGARQAATRYLETWPTGPHAEKARSLLSE